MFLVSMHYGHFGENQATSCRSGWSKQYHYREWHLIQFPSKLRWYQVQSVWSRPSLTRERLAKQRWPSNLTTRYVIRHWCVLWEFRGAQPSLFKERLVKDDQGTWPFYRTPYIAVRKKWVVAILVLGEMIKHGWSSKAIRHQCVMSGIW